MESSIRTLEFSLLHFLDGRYVSVSDVRVWHFRTEPFSEFYRPIASCRRSHYPKHWMVWSKPQSIHTRLVEPRTQMKATHHIVFRARIRGEYGVMRLWPANSIHGGPAHCDELECCAGKYKMDDGFCCARLRGRWNPQADNEALLCIPAMVQP